MTKKLTKVRFYIDYDKEEKWVNEMCQQGWHLVKFGFGYFKFEKGLPGEYIYRNELLDGLATKNDSKEYLSFLSETGVEIVSKFGSWAYFRKNGADGPFELYSDTSSKIQYLNRIYYLFLFLGLLNLILGLFLFLDVLGVISQRFTFVKMIALMSLIVAFLTAIPVIKVFKRRKALKSKLEIFHD